MAIVSPFMPHCVQASGAAAGGQLDTLEWLWDRLRGGENAVVWRNAIDAGSAAGQLKAVEWLINRDCRGSKFAIRDAARNGHVKVVDLLWKRFGNTGNHDNISYDLGRSGSIPMLQWMLDQRISLDDSCCCAAAALLGHFDALRFLRRHHCPWDGWTLKYAAGNGHLDILQWALANGCPWTEEDRRECLRHCPRHRIGIRRWIGEYWPKEPSQQNE